MKGLGIGVFALYVTYFLPGVVISQFMSLLKYDQFNFYSMDTE